MTRPALVAGIARWLVAVPLTLALAGCLDGCPVGCLPDVGDGGSDSAGGGDGGGQDPGGDPDTPSFTGVPAIEEARDLATRLVAVDGGSCPAPTIGGGWTLTTLAGGTHCLYRWKGDGAPLEATLPDLPACSATNGGQACLGYDYHAVVPLGVEELGVEVVEPNVLHDRLSDQFLDHSERVALLPDGGPSLPVRVAVVDSMPAGPLFGPSGPVATTFSDGPHAHGHAMGWIVHTLSCQSAGYVPQVDGGVPCAADVYFHEALRRCADTDEACDLGRHGTLADLAVAIDGAVDTWLADSGGPAPAVADHGFVISASLGWHERFTAAESGAGAIGPAASAVRAAIRRARCHGALFVAATGTEVGGAVPGEKAFYPAHWETEQAPDAAECVALGVPGGGIEFQDGTVRAAAGLTFRDLTLRSTPALGQPRMAAPAMAALVPTWVVSPDLPALAFTAPLTGSSVAAAVLSAAAATTWAYAPDHDARELMAQAVLPGGRSLADAGGLVDVNVEPDYCIGGSDCCLQGDGGAECFTNPTLRVSVCGALGRLYPGCYVNSCAPPTDCSCPVQCSSEYGSYDADGDSMAPVVVLPEAGCGDLCVGAGEALPASDLVAGCPEQVFELAGDASSTIYPCARSQHYGSALNPRVDPAPDRPVCPTCLAYLHSAGDPTVQLQIDLQDGFPPIVGVTMKVKNRANADGASYDITELFQALAPEPGVVSTLEVGGIDPALVGHDSQVELDFAFESTTTPFSRANELPTWYLL